MIDKNSNKGAIPVVVLLVVGAFVAGGSGGAFIAWWLGQNTATIMFSAFAIGILMGLVFLPNAAKIIRWGNSVIKELKGPPGR